MPAPDHPLNWLPKPGAAVEIPGGIMWCSGWHYESTIQNNEQHFNGRITLDFDCVDPALIAHFNGRLPAPSVPLLPSSEG